MKQYEIKSITGTIADIDEAQRRVKVAVSETESKDLDNDVIAESAYNQTIKERGPMGANLIWHLTDHSASLKSAVGKPSEISMDGRKLVFVTDVAKTTWGNDVLEMYKSGVINQHSIGFRITKQEPINAGHVDEYRLIKEVLLYEGSAVLWGANPNTPTLTVGKSMTKEEQEKYFFDTLEELSNFTKLFRKGHLTDPTFEMLQIKMAQLIDNLRQLSPNSSQPALNAVDPAQDQKLLEVISSFTNNLILQNGFKRVTAAT